MFDKGMVRDTSKTIYSYYNRKTY